MLPHALDRVDDWRRLRARAGRLLVAVDFDGTLAPIVDRPEDATPLPEAVEALRRLAARPDTDVAIVSGRGLGDVRDRLPVLGIVFAGNHGMEIEGPGIERVHEGAAAARPALEECSRRLARDLARIEGAQLEDKGLTLSVHYRRVPSAEGRQEARRLAHEACDGRPGLRVTEGKMVVEVRPDVEWDKGRATRFLLESVEGERAGSVPALFIGDDRTDEDAFAALRGAGEGVIVADPPPAPGESLASSYLRSPAEVARLLEALGEDG